jgi:hypothetical protein
VGVIGVLPIGRSVTEKFTFVVVDPALTTTFATCP